MNDSFGHAAGDERLRQLGPRLTTELRKTDLLVRLGGDEFGVVIPDREPEYAMAVAKRMLAQIPDPFHLQAVTVRIGASVGLANAPGDASDSASLLRCADLAMYRAKVGGGGQVELYRPALDDDLNRLQLVDKLRAAIDQKQLVLHYQPQLDLHTGEIRAVAALLRWPHPGLGLVPPLDFLPLAEEAGLMPQLTAAVLDQTLARAASWASTGSGLDISVNASISNLLDPEFLTMVRDRLAFHRVPPSRLVVEITETSVIKDFQTGRNAIGRLRQMGVEVSIDDFGAGFTSLAYRAKLEVSELKLDQSFVNQLTASSSTGLDLVRATVDLGHALGLQVLADGVEDGVTLNLLTGVGCDLAQRDGPARLDQPSDPSAASRRTQGTASQQTAVGQRVVAIAGAPKAGALGYPPAPTGSIR